MNFTECFKHQGVALHRSRGAWSGVSGDGGVVVVSLWRDAIRVVGASLYYDDREHLAGKAASGARLRLKHLNHALANGAEVRVVEVSAIDPAARPRTIRSACPLTRYTLRIVGIDQVTGAFHGEIVRVDFGAMLAA